VFPLSAAFNACLGAGDSASAVGLLRFLDATPGQSLTTVYASFALSTLKAGGGDPELAAGALALVQRNRRSVLFTAQLFELSIEAMARCGCVNPAAELLKEMEASGYRPAERTYVSALLHRRPLLRFA
jgi:hypothetical protein